MKRKLILIGFLIVAVAAVGLAFVFAPLAGISGAGVSLAMAGGVGTLVTGNGNPGSPESGAMSVEAIADANANILRPEIRDKVVLIQPAATPLDTILRTLGNKKTSKSFEVRYYSSGVRDIKTTVSEAVAAVADTAVNKPAGYTFKIKLDNTDFCDDNETLYLPSIKVDGQPLRLHVFERNSGELTVMAINGSGTNHRDNPAIPATTEVIRVGNAMNELDAKCNPFGIIPEDSMNFIQIAMSSLTQGEYEKTAKKEIKFELDDIKEQVWYDFRRKRELQSLLSVKAKIYHNSKPYYHTDGLIPQVMNSGRVVSLTKSKSVRENLIVLSNYVFNGNNGASSRFMFCGSGILDWIGTNIDFTKMMEAKNVEIVPGLKFNRIETQYGTLNVKFHPDFDNVGMKENFLIIDPTNIDIYNRTPMRTRKIDNKATGAELSEQFVLEEAFCVNAVNPDTHCFGSLAA